MPDGMTKHGYSTSLRSQYVSAGWLVQLSRAMENCPLSVTRNCPLLG